MGNKDASYVERAINSYFQEKFLGGFRVLLQKKYLPFSIILFSVLAMNITALILYFQDISWMTLTLLSNLILVSYLIGVAIILFSIISAIWQKYLFQLILVYVGIILAILSGIFFDLTLEDTIIQLIKLTFIIIWTLIACFSVFFAIFYLFTGISGKVLVAGKDDEHIFMGNIFRLIAFASLGLSIYILILNYPTFNAMLVAILGIIASLVYLIYSWSAKRNKTTTNFLSILGCYNIYITYHLSVSIHTTEKVKNVLTEIILFIFTAFYYIQSKVQKVEDIGAERLESKEKKRRIFFQQRLIISEYSKRILGELVLVLMTIGITLGYSTVLLSLFIDPSLPLVNQWSIFTEDIGIPLAAHRLSSIISLLIFLVSFIIFQFSEEFRDFATNNYNFTQGLKILGDKVGSFGRRIGGLFKRKKNKS